MTYNTPESYPDSDFDFDNTHLESDVIRGRVVSDLELEAIDNYIQSYLENHFYIGDIPLSIVGPDGINIEHNCPMCKISVDEIHSPQAILWEHKALQELLKVDSEELLDWFNGEYKGRNYQVRVIPLPD